MFLCAALTYQIPDIATSFIPPKQLQTQQRSTTKTKEVTAQTVPTQATSPA